MENDTQTQRETQATEAVGEADDAQGHIDLTPGLAQIPLSMGSGMSPTFALQDPKDKRTIKADAKLKKVF